jgi:hypothetical protein
LTESMVKMGSQESLVQLDLKGLRVWKGREVIQDPRVQLVQLDLRHLLVPRGHKEILVLLEQLDQLARPDLKQTQVQRDHRVIRGPLEQLVLLVLLVRLDILG